MKTARPKPSLWLSTALSLSAFLLPLALHAGNRVMGEIQLEGKSKVEKTSGVWVDGQYVGYLKELKGDKKLLLLPGEHTISVRQNGYRDFTEQVLVQPGQKQVVEVIMQKAPTGELPAAWATLKISVNPSRAAVFLDGRFVGHVGEFAGAGHGLLVAPGNHQIKIALPGYRTFETQVNSTAHQTVEVKTDLLKEAVPASDPALKLDESQLDQSKLDTARINK